MSLAKFFQASLIFASRARREATNGAALGQVPAYFKNYACSKNLSETNALAYFAPKSVTKMFVTLTQGFRQAVTPKQPLFKICRC